jgi:hypothetical protein
MSVIDPLNAATISGAALAADEAAIDTAIASASLALAQQSKSAFIDGIFNALRQAPIAYTVSAGAYSWDATDESVAALTLAVLSALVTGCTSAFAALIADVNATFAALVSDIENWGAGGIGPGLLLAAQGDTGASAGSITGGEHLTGGETPLGTIQWTPVGASSPVTLTAADATGLLAAIAARRAGLQAVRLSKQNALAALTSTPSVIAFSASSSWP